MDEGKRTIPPSELDLWSASDRASAVGDELVAEERQRHSGQITLGRTAPSSGGSVAVYCGNAEEVSGGFLIALEAMGFSVGKKTGALKKFPVARSKP